jgi:hypothetical protein
LPATKKKDLESLTREDQELMLEAEKIYREDLASSKYKGLDLDTFILVQLTGWFVKYIEKYYPEERDNLYHTLRELNKVNMVTYGRLPRKRGTNHTDLRLIAEYALLLLH